MPAWFGIALAPAIAVLGLGAEWLTVDGALAASIVGATVFLGGGIPGAAMLVFFFVSGSTLGALKHRARTAPSLGMDGRRNARQVLANGLWCAAGAALTPFTPAVGTAMMVGALAAGQGDTWATEIGTRAGGAPRLITTWARVPKGTSGGVTGIGTMGGIAGAAALAAMGAALGFPARAAVTGFIGGLAGIAADSLLGATLQARFRCDTCNEETERRTHSCGRACRVSNGWRWLDNDGVNLIATGTGGITAVLLCCWL